MSKIEKKTIIFTEDAMIEVSSGKCKLITISATTPKIYLTKKESKEFIKAIKENMR